MKKIDNLNVHVRKIFIKKQIRSTKTHTKAHFDTKAEKQRPNPDTLRLRVTLDSSSTFLLLVTRVKKRT